MKELFEKVKRIYLWGETHDNYIVAATVMFPIIVLIVLFVLGIVFIGFALISIGKWYLLLALVPAFFGYTTYVYRKEHR